MRRVLASALLAAAVTACSVEAPAYRATPTAPRPTAAATPDIRPLTYEVTPLEVRTGTGAVTKTVLTFSNPNPFVLDWFMTVRSVSADGKAVTDERIGNAGVPPDRTDPKFQNWYFPIPPGLSWTVVRSDKSFAKSDVQEFKVARSLVTIGEVDGVRLASQRCSNDSALGVIGCQIAIETTSTVPAFSKLHLVVVVRSTDSSRAVLGALQWRPEILAAERPWLSLAAGDKMDIQMHDGYPTPKVPWEYEVMVHAYQYSSQ
jgi:hypothetical protein